jgi:transposase-like protein
MESTKKRDRDTPDVPRALKNQSVKVVRELRQVHPRDHGVIARVARQLGVEPESLQIWVRRAEFE